METFDALKRTAADRWAARTDRARARIEVSISSCSLHVGAAATLDAVRATAAQLGIDAVVGQVGDTGMCWAEPIVSAKGEALGRMARALG